MKDQLGTLLIVLAVAGALASCQADAVDNGDTANDSQTMDMLADGDVGMDVPSDTGMDTGGDTPADSSPDQTPDVPVDTNDVMQDMGTFVCTQNMSSGCLDYCQFTSDCIAANPTLAGLLGDGLMSLGFDPMAPGQCGGCIAVCEADEMMGGLVDEDVLACIASSPGVGMCSSGVDGAAPWVEAIDLCCLGETTSEVCNRACAAINAIIPGLSSTCQEF